MNHTEYELLYRNMREPDTSIEEDEDELKIKCEPDIGGDTGRYYKCS